MEHPEMSMTRANYEQSVAVKVGIIAALRDNVGDDFTASEIASAVTSPADLRPNQVSSILKSMVADGLVTRRHKHDGCLYRLNKVALAWEPSAYDWKVARSVATLAAKQAPMPAKPAAKRTSPPIANLDASSQRKPADNHPWVHPPAVRKPKNDQGAITRPLPIHLHTREQLIALALEEVPFEPALGTGTFLVTNPPFEAGSSQPTVDDSVDSGQAILDDFSPSEIPNSSPIEANHPEFPEGSPVAVIAPDDAQQTLPAESHEDEPPAQHRCSGHCANHAKASDDLELTQAMKRALAEIGNLTDSLEALENQNAALIRERDAAREDLAISQRDRDLLHQRLREQARHSPSLMVEGLMELLRLALLRIPYPGQSNHLADTGNMVPTSEARP